MDSDTTDSAEKQYFDDTSEISDDEYEGVTIDNYLTGDLAIEHFQYKCITLEKAKEYLDNIIDRVCDQLMISPSIAKLLLVSCKWNEDKLLNAYLDDTDAFLVAKQIKPAAQPKDDDTAHDGNMNELEEPPRKRLRRLSAAMVDSQGDGKLCDICMQNFDLNQHKALCCEHGYCKECWQSYLINSINSGHCIDIECMSSDCSVLAPEDFVRSILLDNFVSLKRFDRMTLQKCIDSYPLMRRCGNGDCEGVFKVRRIQPRLVTCSQCKAESCFKCGDDYHAPVDCQMLRKWKSLGENHVKNLPEPPNENREQTKYCPKCGVAIERDGGCISLTCSSCHFNFCWLCLGSWEQHKGLFSCIKQLKENDEKKNDDDDKSDQESKRFVSLFGLWKYQLSNKETDRTFMQAHDDQINNSVPAYQDLLKFQVDAYRFLIRCRNTLQHSYPKIYFMTSSPEKSLFEYQQMKFETEVGRLTWKIRNFATNLKESGQSGRVDLEANIKIVHKLRKVVVEDFFTS